MFPAPSPNSQQLFAQLASGGATPSTIDFHRTALSAAAKRETQNQNQNQPQNQQQQPASSVTSQPQEMANGVAVVKTEAKQPGAFDPHDNDAANGLFMLAQGRNGAQPPGYAPATQAQSHPQPPPAPAQSVETSPQMGSVNGAGSAGAGSSVRGVSEGGSAASDESEQARPSTRGKGKRNSTGGGAVTNGRRKAEEPPAKAPPSKKAKTNLSPPPDMNGDESHSDDDDDMKKHDDKEGGSKSKMTDEEKRKNFLERNRYVL